MTTNYREILRLKSLGLNKTEIASSAQCARNTVSVTLERAKACGLQWPLPESMSDKELTEKLFPGAPGKAPFKMPDYEHAHREMQRSGVTLTLLWMEYCDQCKAEGAIPYQSTQFNKYYNDYLNRINATMHLNHKPGEIMQVDWAGDTASVVDTDTGEIIPAYVFVATLPYSLYSYVEAFFSMNQEAWITAHVNAYRYFGGVTRMIQCDNLKTGVEKHGRDEIILNKTYQELAEHYATAIVPARVRAPKDKAAVEGTVGVISTYILAALRNRQFLSLSELNEAIWDRLESFNHKPFQKRDGSRASVFAEEQTFLRSLPAHPYELATWKVASVGPNYHVSVERMNYSVPFEYIKQKVDVRITRSTIEVFFGGNRICSHCRLYGRFNQYSTVQEHMPPEHQKYIEWNGERFVHWAEKIGDRTETAVKAILSSYKVEQQGYKACMGLLKLADKYTPERLENACRRAFEYTPQPSFKNIQTILATGQDRLPDEPEPRSSSQYGFTRGAEYYGGRDENAD
jgi:transposase